MTRLGVKGSIGETRKNILNVLTVGICRNDPKSSWYSVDVVVVASANDLAGVCLGC